MEKLVKQIIDLYKNPKSFSGRRDWALKLLSLLFAVFLWYFVVGEDKVDMNVLIPVEVVNLPHDLVISNQYKRQLDVAVSGSREQIKAISRQNITRTVDLSQAKPGTVVIENKPDSIPLTRGVRVLRIQPTHISFLLDKLLNKELPVNPVITGHPPEGFEIHEVVVKPSVITLTGPQTVIADEASLTTTPIDISGLTESVVKEAPLDLRPELAELIGESVVSVQIVISERMVEKSVNLPIALQEPKEHLAYHLSQDTVQARIKVPLSVARKNGLRNVLLAKANVGTLDAGDHQLTVNLDIPKDFKLIEISPATIEVGITPVKTSTKQKTNNR